MRLFSLFIPAAFRCSAFALLLSSLVAMAFPLSAKAETVAMGSFAHADFERNDPATSDALVTAIQAGLETQAHWKFVERGEMERIFTEVGLSRRGLTSADSAARVGKLLKADLLLSGTFHGSKGSKSYVILECDELSRAESVGQTRVELNDVLAKGHLTLPSPEDLQKIVAAAGRLLESSSAEVEAGRKRTTLKLLFLSNRTNDSSLKGVERLLSAGLDGAFASSPTHRLLRLDRPENATNESELALLGLAEADSSAWMQVADYYFWGSYETIDKDLKITLTLWNGREQPVEMTETGPAGDVPALSARLARKILEGATPVADKTGNGQDQRKKIAELLCYQAKRLAQSKSTAGVNHMASESNREEQRRLLATAIFFAPTERSGWIQLLGLRLSDDRTATLSALLQRVGNLEYALEVAERFLLSHDGRIEPQSLYGLGGFSEGANDRMRQLESDFGYFEEDLSDIYAGRNLLALKERVVASYRIHLMRLARQLATAGPDQNDNFQQAAEFILTAALEHSFTTRERKQLIDMLWPRLKVVIFAQRAWSPTGVRISRLDGLLRDFYASENQFALADELDALSPAELAAALATPAPANAPGLNEARQAEVIEKRIASFKSVGPGGKPTEATQKYIDEWEKELAGLRAGGGAARNRATAFLESHAKPGTPLTVTESDLLKGAPSNEVTLFHPLFKSYPAGAKQLQVPWLRQTATQRAAEGYPATVINRMRALADEIEKETGPNTNQATATLSAEWNQRRLTLLDPKMAAIDLAGPAREGDLPSLQALLDREAPIAAAGAALVEAIRNEQWPAAFFIMEKGYDPVAPWPNLDAQFEGLRWSDHPGRTALAEAAIKGRTDLVDMLLKKGVRFDQKSQAGLYAVLQLTQSHRHELLQAMLKSGASPNNHLDRSLEPLYYAVRARDLQSLTMLVDAGADPAIRAGHTIGMSPGLTGSLQWEKFDVQLLDECSLDYCAKQNWLEGARVLLATRHADLREVLLEKKPHHWATQPAVRAAFVRAELEAAAPPGSTVSDGAGIDLFTAIAARDQPAFAAAIARPGSLDFRGVWGETALMFACQEKAAAMAQQLLDAGALLEQFDTVGSTPLCYAARNGDIALVEAMVRKGAQLDLVQGRANRALDQAIMEGKNAAMALKLIQLGASFSPDPRKPDLIPLFKATINNMPDVVKELLRRGDDPHQLADGYSIFFPAARSNNPELIQLYVDLKCDLTLRKNNWTPLMSAVRWGAVASVRKFLELGLRDPNAAMMAVSMVKDLEPPNRPDPADLRSLHYRPDYRGCLEVMEELGQIDSTPSARAAIFWRASHSIPEIDAYLTSGGDVNFRDVTTPLQKAAGIHNVELANFLLNKGANPNVCGTDPRAWSPLRNALNTPALVELLFKHGANPNELSKDDSGWTVFAGACVDPSVPVETVRLFVRYGANPETDARAMLAKYGETKGPRSVQVISSILDGK
ncbi:MAG TPA: ankyrin repeat domain-containing protein [Lacunisphaera sp.]|jgi:ankyrin repeat protein